MIGLSPADVRAANLQPISGVVTNQPISMDFGLNHEGSLHLRIDIEVSGVTVAGSITAKLQTRSAGGAFHDLVGANATTTITGNGTFSITQVVERTVDQPNMPLQKQAQVVLTTTNAGDLVTVNKVWLLQGL